MRDLSSETTAQFIQRYKLIDNISIEAACELFRDTTASDSRFRVDPLGRSQESSGCTISSCSIADMKLVYSHWGADLTYTCLDDHGTFLIARCLGGTSDVVDPHHGSIEARDRQAALHRFEEGTKVIAANKCSMIDLVLPFDVLEERARSLYDKELNDGLRFSPAVDVSRGSGNTIAGQIDYMALLASREPECVNNPLVAASLREHVLFSVLALLPHNYKHDTHRSKVGAAPKSVRLAEEYMRAHADQPVTVAEIARHARCSERALFNAFKTFREKSPMAALLDIRLELADSDLRAGNGTVSSIASCWGFTNSGRFAKLYAQKFGCMPSEALRA